MSDHSEHFVTKPLVILDDSGLQPLPAVELDALLASPAIERFARERLRQITEEGFTPEHDAGYTDRALAHAAVAYIISVEVGHAPPIPKVWPWPDAWFKPVDDIGTLVKAGALLAAEVDRLIAAEPTCTEGPGPCIDGPCHPSCVRAIDETGGDP